MRVCLFVKIGKRQAVNGYEDLRFKSRLSGSIPLHGAVSNFDIM